MQYLSRAVYRSFELLVQSTFFSQQSYISSHGIGKHVGQRCTIELFRYRAIRVAYVFVRRHVSRLCPSETFSSPVSITRHMAYGYQQYRLLCLGQNGRLFGRLFFHVINQTGKTPRERLSSVCLLRKLHFIAFSQMGEVFIVLVIYRDDRKI